MRFPRLTYWLACSAIVLALLFAALGRRDKADAPPPPPPLTAAESTAMAEAAPINPALMIKVTPAWNRVPGVAFSVADGGVWLTAASVVAGCPKTAILIGAGQGIATKVQTAPASDVAVLTTGGGAPALPLAPASPDKSDLAFALGYLGAYPAEVASRVLGPETLARRDRAHPSDAVTTLAEIGRTEGLKGSLQALDGAPVLDGMGRVVGLVIGEAPRRGRLYAAPLPALTAALTAARLIAAPNAVGQPVTPDDYGLAADDLRRNLRIAPVVCAG